MGKRWVRAVLVTSVWAVVSVAQAQGPQLSRVMREKLLHMQMILETVVTSDWNGLDAHARELARLTEAPGWTVLNYPEYEKHSAAFVARLRDLQHVSGERDSQSATRAYTALVEQCVECHTYVARARIAR